MRKDRIHRKAVLGVDDLVTHSRISLTDELQNLIRPDATDDLFRCQPIALADCRAQLGMVGRGIAVHLTGRLRDRSHRCGRRAKRVLI